MATRVTITQTDFSWPQGGTLQNNNETKEQNKQTNNVSSFASRVISAG
jgi:hypothetical protein